MNYVLVLADKIKTIYTHFYTLESIRLDNMVF